ncbi:uncharacterized protein LOC129759945 [Uranotaenia lowii]|uniref:uncharacterized protein LOC129759945 n=1 Tax=Uranotaenia lowii TaxID=190385 RepID=UPI002478CEC6|nr:uncharacterized protein LOC129759945 [Uranotaenia lowii]
MASTGSQEGKQNEKDTALPGVTFGRVEWIGPEQATDNIVAENLPATSLAPNVSASGQKKLGTRPKKVVCPKSTTSRTSKRNPLRTVRKRTDHHCGTCNERDSSKMVLCDKCEVWHHFSCVGVTSNVADRSTWICSTCDTTTIQTEHTTPSNRKQSIGNLHHGIDSEQRVATTLSDRNGNKNNERHETNSVARVSVSQTSSRSDSRRTKELRLQKLKELTELQQKYIEQKYAILEEPETEGSEFNDACSIDKMSNIEQWMRKTNIAGKGESGSVEQDDCFEEDTMRPPLIEKHPTAKFEGITAKSSRQQSNFAPVRGSHRRLPGDFNPEQRSTPLATSDIQRISNYDPNEVCFLNRSQIAARQAINKELPDFDGSPEDWPLFLSTYHSSTRMCGFTNEENMLRLRKCLRGKALEAVRSRLLHENNVTGVISTLKMIFGRPETIIHAMIARIRTLTPPNIDRLETIVNFALTVENLCANIEACGVPDFVYNASLRIEMIQKLPSVLKLQWANHSRTVASPTLLDFSNWLHGLAEDASAVMVTASIPKTRREKKEGFLYHHEENSEDECSPDAEKFTAFTHQEANQPREKLCVSCSGSCITVTKCPTFLALDHDSKWKIVKEKRLCSKCLKKHNGSCRQQKQCGNNGCTRLHHNMLHKPDIPPRDSSTNTVVEHSCNVNQRLGSGVLFRIIPVILYGSKKSLNTFAFIDDGSELTLMEDQIAKELDLDGPTQSLCLRWTSGTHRTESASRRISLDISGTDEQSKRYRLANIRTVESLQIRPQTLDMMEMRKKFKHLQNIPIQSYENACPRIIIGLEHAKLGHPFKSREGNLDEPIAVKSCLGWTVYGKCSNNLSTTLYVNQHSLLKCPCEKTNDEDLNLLMKNFFAIDNLGLNKSDNVIMSREDQRAITLLENHTFQSGRYEVNLLWKYDHARLPDSKSMALSRWKCLQRRLQKDSHLSKILEEKMNDYVAKGYARLLSSEELVEDHPRIWYLPVFPITNPNKPGKTRLVWDAAAKAHGISLNSLLLKGPDLLTSLFAVLLKFRESKIAICGDIREMYHQVLIRKEDQQCQRFFWGKNDETNMPLTYIMQVMTFGACSSPCTAQFIKNHNAEQFKHKHPAATSAIIHNHYVDDMLISTETEEEAINLAKAVKIIHSNAGFELRNFKSNSSYVADALEGQSESNEMSEKDMNVGRENSPEKVLGMWWNTTTDCFMFKMSPSIDSDILSGTRTPTKREVLRFLMQIFDPLGLIGHLLMFLKCLLQEIWRTSVDWDDVIQDNEYQKWKRWLEVFPAVTTVSIPRCYRNLCTMDSSTEVQMHTFVDASENGMAAAVYLRFENNGITECALLSTKTRVAPLKFLSIPRSELQASVLGARLANSVKESISITLSRRYFWTDSRTVLSWLSADHRKYSQFVSHRVSDILESTTLSEWHWIPSKLNVADDGTKWKNLPDLSKTSRWFCGPDFLLLPESEWPLPEEPLTSTDIEMRPHILSHSLPLPALIPVENFSLWQTLLRKTAYALRYIYNAQRLAQKQPILSGPLQSADLCKAEQYLFRYAQREAYPDEIALLSAKTSHQKKSCIPKNSPLYKLCTFLDENSVLRMQGRISSCQYAPPDAKNPIILPRNHHITKLVVASFHHRYNHQNHETIINEIRQRYHVPKLRSAYKKIRSNCQTCKNLRARPQPPLMSELPVGRLAAFSRPFSHMGLDYFGPMIVVNGRKQEKRWGVLATCLTIRAIHLQVVHTLTTNSCILAIRNIMARRGVPVCIYSDRGTNFIGADRELKSLLKTVNQNKLMEEFVSPHTQWNFNPPASPHMGGAWERLIRTVKNNLVKLNPNHRPNDEILENMLIEIENVVNSRPLTHVAIEDENSPALTPNHFLLGSSNGLKPWVAFDDSALAVRRSWQFSQIMANTFWRQWVHDYLPTLTRRTKWFNDAKQIEVGDIAVIVDPNLPRNCWPKGRIISTHLSPDGRVRWATIQTTSGIYDRPATKLAVLDVGVSKVVPQANSLCTSRGTVTSAN